MLFTITGMILDCYTDSRLKVSYHDDDGAIKAINSTVESIDEMAG
jgi:hypothetical protein